MTTIRKNAWKRFSVILSQAVLIRQYRYDDMGDTLGTATPEEVIDAGQRMEFDRVYQDDQNGIVRFCIHRNWSFTAYPSVKSAEDTLTPDAFAKYFPQHALDAKGEPVDVTKTVGSARCSRCMGEYAVPLYVTSEYRPSLGRKVYFHQKRECSPYCEACSEVAAVR